VVSHFFFLARNPARQDALHRHLGLTFNPRQPDRVAFSEFVTALLNSPFQYAVDRNIYNFMEDGKVAVDYVMRYENLDADYRTVCRRIEVPYKPLPRIKASHRPTRSSYTDYYDEYLKDLVATKHARLINLFDYRYGA
jgi:hypothetical protein